MIMCKLGCIRLSVFIICFILSTNILACFQEESIQKNISTQNSLKLEPIYPTKKALSRLGNLIYINECGGDYGNLVTWNKGEKFPSLGIGHFIWYPAGYNGPFTETFPELIHYLQKNNVQIPSWLIAISDAPWQSREIFLPERDSKQVEQLRDLLFRSINEQTLFIVDRLNQSLPDMLCAAEPTVRKKIYHHFYVVAKAPDGLYALLDYVNFKGEGTSLTERYNGQGWGLLQVLQEMKPVAVPNQQAVFEFAQAGMRVLERRVQNSPKERNEARWLPGWTKRLASYYQQRK